MTERLEKYGTITDHLAGRQMQVMSADGPWLKILFRDGHCARIGFQDAAGNQVQGLPFLKGREKQSFRLRCNGQRLEYLGIQDGWLIVRTTTGLEEVIGVQDQDGQRLRCEPFLENLDVTIVLPGVGIDGSVSPL